MIIEETSLNYFLIGSSYLITACTFYFYGKAVMLRDSHENIKENWPEAYEIIMKDI